MNKIKLVIIMCSMLSAIACNAQKIDMKNIENVITEFSKAGDENNVEKLAGFLDNNYRIVMNRLFGSTEVSVMPKSVYLEKIKSKEFGGDPRALKIENIIINGTTASAKVTFTGSKMTFVSLIMLLQNEEGDWKLISDVPTIK